MEDNIEKNKEIQNEIERTAGIIQGDLTLTTLLESLAEGVVIINEQGKIILVNNRLLVLTNYQKDELVGKSLNLLVPLELHGQHAHHLKHFFKAPKIRPMGMGLNLFARKKDQTNFPIEISLSFLDTDSGRLGLAFITDITLRKGMEDELKRVNIELDKYAHTIAHNLNSSLSGMIGMSEMLLDSGHEISKEDHDLCLKEIAQGGRKMNNVIKELLMFATLKKGDVDVKKVNMFDIVHGACERLNYQIEEKNAQITMDDDLLECMGYAPWIEEVFYNFISNALKYGGDPPKIEVYSEKASEGFIKYSVKDSGQGVKSELEEVIFKENDHVKDKLSQGHGLGLSIVNRIIERLDGKLSLETEQGKGSIFSFYLKQH